MARPQYMNLAAYLPKTLNGMLLVVTLYGSLCVVVLLSVTIYSSQVAVPCNDGRCLHSQHLFVKQLTVDSLNQLDYVNASQATDAMVTNEEQSGYVALPGLEPLSLHCSECSFVTSSGRLKGEGAGKEIDEASCVIRMNAAPIDGYEDDVGRKTTFRIIGHRNFPRMLNSEARRKYHLINSTTKADNIVVVWLYAVDFNPKRNPARRWAAAMAKKYRDTNFYMANYKTMLQNEEIFQAELGISRKETNTWLTTGWNSMLFALDVCKKVTVYGMIYEDFCKEHPNDNKYYHYFDKVQRECKYYSVSENKLRTGHKFVTEKAVFARWSETHNITFKYPSWENVTTKGKSLDTPFLKKWHAYKQCLHDNMNETVGTYSCDEKKSEVKSTNNRTSNSTTDYVETVIKKDDGTIVRQRVYQIAPNKKKIVKIISKKRQ
ncbi:alpha-N-acetyl-neuraminyl-2,3-beta-galactosyl-1,3-N-acetyl-galactosaminide alpha-2,6-sialyltransferase-like isoform X2 [Anneissia japonica]|uniref:alpha-N-acetyl-neuraminyl-2,3-beta-galactosyl-1, 3-N-acetyl-galactosaminide alpha-2,6-sialyltransferase-like isoform X2 n=1 Tax=Anneissia japonica TaxID=1529436 RepID=UPI0014257D48|nr:alpha-N-acetyl-neuraminyl-2,3-beta-galactosyl-1,3-N-acetyl-galactosaminide alpha-2,6-sialyltransferase-like isoform X2 [Anneissia japonica]